MPSYLAPGRTISTHDGLSGTHAAVIDDAGPTIPEIPVHLFFSEVMPRPSVLDHIPAIFAALNKGPQPHYDYTRQRWLAFPKDPAKARIKEESVFRNFEQIYRAVLQAASIHCQAENPLTVFTNTPGYVPMGDWRKSTSKPDVFFALRERRAGGTPHWMDIVATGEYKRDNLNKRNLDDDSKKVLWNMQQTMRYDPCRRFTFGFTIENREMRIWYASRADVLVSTPFDFMNDPLLLVEFFLILSYADIHALGWDPTMRCEWRGLDKPPHYIITVRSEETGEEVDFRATDVLSDRGADALRGRGTRVFKVRRLEDGAEIGDELVLKDCWVDADRVSEGKIMADIKRDAAGTPQEAVLESGLLKLDMHGDVYVNGEIDKTISKERRKELFVWDDVFLVHRSDAKVEGFNGPRGFAAKDKLHERAEKGSHPSRIGDVDSLGPTIFCPKKHYRIMFKETCKPLFLEDRLGRILYILGQTCKILDALHAIGWVHRDISSGNILTEGDTVKLADLEYAKTMGKASDRHREIRTGTADFMSVEVFSMDYMFTAYRGEALHVKDDNIEPGWDVYAPKSCIHPERERNTVPAPWFYNPLHDLESVFWLISYYILSRDIYLPDGLDWPSSFQQESETARAARIKAQYQIIEPLFIQRDSCSRLHFLRSFQNLQRQLEEAPLHPALQKIGNHLVQVRSALVYQFLISQKTLPIPLDNASSIADDLHKQFGRILHDMRCDLMKNHVFDVRCRPLSAVYATIMANETARMEEKKKAMYKRTAAARKELADKEARLAKESGVVFEDIPGLYDSPTSKTPLADGLRRSQRIASSVVQSRSVDEGNSCQNEKSENTLHHSNRKCTEASSARNIRTKRKHESGTNLGPRRKVYRVATDATSVSSQKISPRPKRRSTE